MLQLFPFPSGFSDVQTPSKRIALFGPYALDLRSAELRKFGTKVKMGEQTFQILRMLLESPGELVGREELRATLWADDTFVDFDHGLNSAVQRLRDCLSDSAEKPRWVETVPRRGYRFVGELKWTDDTPPSEMPANTGVENRDETSAHKSSSAVGGELSKSSKRVSVLGRRSTLLVVAALASLLAALLTVQQVRHTKEAKQAVLIRSLAVLPLENLSADPAQEYFADGMTDELITMLAKNPDLRVVSRTSVMQYKKVHRPLPDVARELGVDGILEGSVERSGNRVHINAQLIYAPQDRHLWAESYDRDLNDLASLQNELAQTIARQVGFSTTASTTAGRHISAEAHDAYLLGRYYWFGDQYDKAREHFLKAIQLQPEYAAAHAALADSYTAPVVLGAPKADMEEAIAKAENAAREAIALDDSNAEAHVSMAAVQFFLRWNWNAADRESARAIELNPRYSEAHHLRAYILLALQRSEEAVQEDRKSMELDPRIRPWALGYMLLRTRQFDAGIAELRARAEVQPDDFFIHEMLSELYWHNGMAAESIQEYVRNSAPKSAAELEAAFRRGGAQGAAEWRLAHAKNSQARMYVSPEEFAGLSAHAGHKEETLHWLEQAYAEHVPWLAFIQNEPDFDFIHSDPRYRAIVKKLGLPPASPRG